MTSVLSHKIFGKAVLANLETPREDKGKKRPAGAPCRAFRENIVFSITCMSNVTPQRKLKYSAFFHQRSAIFLDSYKFARRKFKKTGTKKHFYVTTFKKFGSTTST